MTCLVPLLLTLQSQARSPLGANNQLRRNDPLTGLFNRQHMQLIFELERDRHPRSEQHEDGSGFCVALIDLDHFKKINGTSSGKSRSGRD
jgi:GGDEF domain-containing protein